MGQMSKFNELLKNEQLLHAISEQGYQEPTEIQTKAIPLVLAGHDIIAKSNTGTGKTASFGLPLIQQISEKQMKQVLVVCPTRELALQVEEELRKFCKYIEGIKLVSVFGGVPIDRQIRAIKKGVQIIVGTPGRLNDHIRRKTIKLHDCDCVVLDEADEMLNMGFREDIEFILSKAKPEHQTILFSATMPKPIRQIAVTYLKDPVEIEIKSKHKTVDAIQQIFYDIPRGEKKREVLQTLLSYYNPKLCVIFCNTKAGVDDLVESLSKSDHKAHALHGDIKQERRTKIMNNFKNAKQCILVATDIAARGIDVNNIDLVVNYDLPQDNEIYVHRIGRTGRAGKNGQAITLVQGNRQFNQLKGLMKFTKAEITRQEIPTKVDIDAIRKEKLKQEIVSIAKTMSETAIDFELINELYAEGLGHQGIIAALLAMITNTVDAPVASTTMPQMQKIKRPVLKGGIDIKLSIGKNSRVTPKQIEDAILISTQAESSQIGKIDLRNKYCIVNVDKKIAKQAVSQLDGASINKRTINARFYKKEMIN
ncbi:ATP-dependent RNA helicase DeaD [Breznakia blatticola]|uniref:ATP-dependent RNA helicase CshA n=2 Tax=Breznakia blatticola TaxID=1754012 RepID=A0A4R8A5Q3_9FIRM|nr:ATP-dependent RNA helicase DeaD [Breznakia blatticola]